MISKLFLVVVIWCQYNGYHSAKLVTTKTLQNGQNYFTWNFLLSDTKDASGFRTHEDNILQDTLHIAGSGDNVVQNSSISIDDRNENPLAVEFTPMMQGTTHIADDPKVPLDIDIRFDSTPEETVASKSVCQSSQNKGIYWRAWTGQIPKDAIVAGYSVNDCGIKTEIYFGQAYVPKLNAGIQPGQIFNYSTVMITSFEGIHKIDSPVKVMCGDQETVAWLPKEKATLLNPKLDFVPAGFERDFALFFARTTRNGRSTIGKTVWKNKIMYYPSDGKEASAQNFDVLCYRKSLIENNLITPEIQAE